MEISLSAAHRSMTFASRTLSSPGSIASFNGNPVHERRLQEGDEIRIGCSVFLFLKDEVQAHPSPDSAQTQAETLVKGLQGTLINTALHRHVEKVMEALPPTTRIARDLGAVLKISTIINSIRDTEELIIVLIFKTALRSRAIRVVGGSASI